MMITAYYDQLLLSLDRKDSRRLLNLLVRTRLAATLPIPAGRSAFFLGVVSLLLTNSPVPTSHPKPRYRTRESRLSTTPPLASPPRSPWRTNHKLARAPRIPRSCSAHVLLPYQSPAISLEASNPTVA
ncbi:hypothetical protein MUK42_04240 [Musa troglodytarum]|uniref:Uncharacterized protein n=1 Tax=Musa troglodytarum TaxID=320322 RepID=A0A9E7G5C8_9LILI|nr:hypothetical protein MUK42_04240 [Musa troglodytarum]